MKKFILVLLALVIGIGIVQANPVDAGKAKSVGQKFVQANFDLTKQSSDLTLVYTAASNRGDVCYYVFNVGNGGFVIVSGDDTRRPIIGFSDEGAFDANNIPDGLNYRLNALQSNMNRTVGRSSKATPAVASEWNSVLNRGTLLSMNGGRANTYLVQTKWNQDYPYNYYCPSSSAGPGGRVYAGCVACTMSQVMRFWNYPTQGQGNHCYTYGPYGQQCANFGETTYDWANMPISIASGASQTQIDAVATLMFHCAVSVNMQWSPEGSGAYSADVPGAVSNYFRYSNAATMLYRDSYSRDAWAALLKETFDMGWPVYYCGQSTEGGHAFVCDGYNDNNLFHYNWGWGGSGDGWFDFDEIDYNSSDGACFNFVPLDVYNSAPKAPSSMTVTPGANNALSATITWTNPSQTLNNTTLTNIDQIVVTRNGEIIHTENNVTPGGAMTYVDNEVPRFDMFEYSVYAVQNNAHGKIAKVSNVSFGPTCDWTIFLQSTSFQGWRGGYISISNAAGTEIAQVTTTSSSTINTTVHMPLGHVTFAWSVPTSSVPSMSFIIKDSQNNTVYSFSGSSDELAAGVFFDTNNNCGSTATCDAPSNVVAVADGSNINVSWTGAGSPEYGYNIYRDDLLYRLITSGTSFVDENVEMGGHCYYASALCGGGESDPSNESCATSGDCYPPTDLDYESTATFKTKLKWVKPSPFDGLSGYYIYRKAEGGEYERIKLAGASATSYTDNTALEEGHYYYRIYAYYGDLDCTSAPANWINDDNQFFLHVYYSPTGVEESVAGNVSLFPNPAKASFTVEGQGMTHITVFNMVGQTVYDMDCDCNSKVITLDGVESGVYMVKVSTKNGDATKRISIIR